jgi:hypothetical protein
VPALGEFSDPRLTQRRIATTPSGRRVDVPITGDDRLRLINRLPSRWPTVIKARERGETIEQIHRWAKAPLTPEHECQGKCQPPCLRCMIASIYAYLETELHEIAQRRAKLMV